MIRWNPTSLKYLLNLLQAWTTLSPLFMRSNQRNPKRRNASSRNATRSSNEGENGSNEGEDGSNWEALPLAFLLEALRRLGCVRAAQLSELM
ncbi:hypothetical protein Y032_0516g2791 [Ancylostoma ceylanicum]|uniref:Uncharacterized protein n=1 Tax=Ancylostoma ceylanicum TaxID=53326 RepID=A0A016WT23_9BILA|nr:hypothetical protein Y032_0516g2791 [Ancylostoma ceylanicum]